MTSKEDLFRLVRAYEVRDDAEWTADHAKKRADTALEAHRDAEKALAEARVSVYELEKLCGVEP